MYRPHSRRSRFADFIDWNDYRFDGPLRPRGGQPWGSRRRHPLLRMVVLLAIVWMVARLIRGRRSSGWF